MRKLLTSSLKVPRAALHVPGGDVWSFTVAEGEAEVSEVTTVPRDAVGRELLAMTPQGAEPEDEDAFLETAGRLGWSSG